MKLIFKAYKENAFPKDAFLFIMRNVALNNSFSLDALPQPISDTELKNYYLDGIYNLDKYHIYNSDKKQTLLLELIMNQIRGRISVHKVKNYINENYKESN